MDAEGLVINNDGTFWVSDEYGPYIYRFGPGGNMVQAIAPPDAYTPMRNGSERYVELPVEPARVPSLTFHQLRIRQPANLCHRR